MTTSSQPGRTGLAARLLAPLRAWLRHIRLPARRADPLADPRWLSGRLLDDARLPHPRKTRQEDWWSRPPPPL